MAEELPLFPLDVVLFPGMPLPLHIFEPRYREMIGLCAREERPFGVLLIKEGRDVGPPATPVDVGTMARVVSIDRLEDGRLNIMTVGTQRFRLVNYSAEKQSYLVGDVEPIDEETVEPALVAPLAAEISSLTLRYITLLQMASGHELVPFDLPRSPVDLSFAVGATLRVHNVERQELLQAESTAGRLALEKRLLERESKRIDELLRQKSSGSLGPFSSN